MPIDDQKTSARPGRSPRDGRGRPGLSREQIVAEAIRLLDAEGIEGLSMRKLGTRLGAGAASLYRHVAGKDELIELVLNEVFAEFQVPAADDPAAWRGVVVESAHAMRTVILRHPWTATIIGGVGTVYFGQNIMRPSEDMLAVLETAGFSLREANSATATLVAYVVGMTAAEAAWLTTLTRKGVTEEEWNREMLPAAERAVESFPRLRELYASYAAAQGADGTGDPWRARDEEFAYGLDRVLDGLSAARSGCR
ncbi:TetR/AcrR family transcriptional regulator [Streptomyces cinnamoneus]|uniref:TetR/AcrR family transcriptional regulator n=1 Tax=Streptomyces cinnamoneus TaxID=53446 RepID=UPI0033F0EE35